MFMSVAGFNVGAFGLARHNQNVGPAAGGNGLTQRSRRQKPLLLKFARTIEHQNVEIAREQEVLKTIVEKENVHGLLLFDSMALGKTIFADAKGDTAFQAMLH